MAIENAAVGDIWVPSGQRIALVSQATVSVPAGAVAQYFESFGGGTGVVQIARGRAVKFETVSYGVNDLNHTGKLIAESFHAVVQGNGGGAVVYQYGCDVSHVLLGPSGGVQYVSDDHLLLYSDWNEFIPGGIGATGLEFYCNADITNTDGAAAHDAFIFATALVEFFELKRGH